ncbi:hypothetical protein RN001_015531 [Aquatica leii]|uniref:Uncharacterized protein n=1 Tax=Aquatica leii TaxID=1421715 RepID=A0AAN7PQY0_9COLE|nr:hypothetical protein RN001_015531 [Aquatica leii]
MKIIVVILTIACNSYAQTVSQTAEEWYKETIHPFFSNCICVTGVDEKVVLEWLNEKKYPENACLKCFVKCVLISSGLFNPDGTLNNLKRRGSEIDVNKLKLCYNQTADESDSCQRAYNYNKCTVFTFSA